MWEAKAASVDGQADRSPGTEDAVSGEWPVKRKQVRGLPLGKKPWEMRPGERVPHYYPPLGCVSESRPCPLSPTQARPGS